MQRHRLGTKQDLLRTPGCMGAPVLFLYAGRASCSIAATLTRLIRWWCG